MNRSEFIAGVSAAGVAQNLASKARAPVSPAPDFEFLSGFWMNLHHTLFYQAQVLQTAYQAAPHLNAVNRLVLADIQSVPLTYKDAWFNALHEYQRNYTHLDFVFSDIMRATDDSLTFADEKQLNRSHGLPEPLRDVLNRASLPYRSWLWQKHRAKNDAMISDVERNIRDYGHVFSRRLPQIYQAPWLSQPYRVDITAYADADGSYSNNASAFVHIVMSSYDSGEHGLAELDVLFHEASHSIVGPSTGALGRAIVTASSRIDRPYPEQFWHALIMYCPGSIAEHMFNTEAPSSYQMVWLRNGLFTRVWPRYYSALKTHWQPYMDGKVNLQSAIDACVHDIVSVA